MEQEFEQPMPEDDELPSNEVILRMRAMLDELRESRPAESGSAEQVEIAAGHAEISPADPNLPARNNARITRGRPFGPGNPGKPFLPGNPGRPMGSRHRTTVAIEALLEGQHEALAERAIQKALYGDVNALKFCLDRLAPMRRDRPVAFDLPPIRTIADVADASAALLAALAAGEVTPDEASRVMTLLTAHCDILYDSDREAVAD